MTDDLRKKLDDVVDAVVNGSFARLGIQRCMLVLPLGSRTVIGPGETRILGATHQRAFIVEDICYTTDFEPDRPRWWWRYRVTRWFLRRVLRRRSPITGATPFSAALIVGGRELVFSAASLERVGIDMRIGHQVTGYDPATHEPIFTPHSLPIPIVVAPGVCVDLMVTNEHPTKSASLYVALSGYTGYTLQ